MVLYSLSINVEKGLNMKKGLTILTSIMAAGLLLTGCGASKTTHHGSHAKTTAVKKMRREDSSKSSHKHHVNKKDMDKAGLSTNDIKKDSRAVHQKKSMQPVD